MVKGQVVELQRYWGLSWDKVEDTTSIGGFDKVNTPRQAVFTKRDVLHTVCSKGFGSPWIIDTTYLAW